MDEKRGPGRTKRPAKDDNAGKWDCTVCTFKNPAQAFKCEICDVRKGTSTRKPRVNPDVVAQQAAQQFTAPQPPAKKERLAAPKKERSNSTNSNESSSSRLSERDRSESPEIPPEKPNTSTKDSPASTTSNDEPPTAAGKGSTSKKRKTTRPKLKNIDRSSAQHIAVTVNNITVIITDFKPKKPAKNNANAEGEEFGTNVKLEQSGE